MVRHQQMAQMQKQATITAQESLQVVRSLLRVSVFHVSYLRGLFTEKNFKGVDMENLEGMNVKMLLPHTPESKRLVDWVEQGVYDALKKKHLKTLIYGISTDAGGTSLLEEYKFSFKYGDSGVVTMGVSGGLSGKKKSAAVSASQGYDSVKFQVIRLMRMLVQICQTLDVVPSERYLFMKMLYHDDTPDDYQPPCFKAADSEAVGHFTRRPFSMNIGDIDTHHHTVGLKVLSTLDACELEAAEEFEKSVQNSTMPGATDGSDSDDNKTEAAVDQGEDMHCDEDGGVTSSQEAGYEAVKAFCLKRSEVEVTDIMAELVEVRAAALDSHIIPRLVSAGILAAVPNQPERFSVRRGVATGTAATPQRAAAAAPEEAPRAPHSDKQARSADDSSVDAPPPHRSPVLDDVAAELMQELSVHPGDTYQPTQRQASQDEGQGGRAAAKKRAAPESLDAQMPGGAHGSGGGSGTAKTDSAAKTASPQRPAMSDAMSGRRGRLGRMATSSLGCPSTAVLPELSQPQAPLFFESQQSQPGGAKRRPKMSVNEQAIRQSKRARTAASQQGGRS